MKAVNAGESNQTEWSAEWTDGVKVNEGGKKLSERTG